MPNLLQGLGQAKPVSDFITTAGQYQQTQASLETQRLTQQKMQAEALQLEKDNKEYLLDGAVSLFPERSRPFIAKAMKMAGAVTQEGIVVGKEMRNAPKYLKDFGLLPQVYQAEIDGLIKENESLSKKTDDVSHQKALENSSQMAVYKRLLAKELGEEKQDVKFGKPGDVPFINGVQGEALPNKEDGAWVSSIIKVGGKDVRIRTNMKTGKEEQVSTGPAPGTTVNVGTGKADALVIGSLIKEMPKLRSEAVEAETNLARIDKMNSLLDKGLGGKVGQVKAWLAPYAEGIGINVQSLSEAQTYELLAKTLGGSMRIAVIGPGPVSEYEQELLQQVNAGGNAATGAARELLSFYRKGAMDKVRSYNDSIDALKDDAPAASRIYRKIEVGEKKLDKTLPDPDGIR